MKTCAKLRFLSSLAAVCLATPGCSVLTYSNPNGERFTRCLLGAHLGISSLALESDTNGVRRVELRGYEDDTTQSLGTVTEAAVRAAVQSAK